MKKPSATIKHVPFHSIYRQEYEVVEERRDNLSLFPHTDQLPVISRAINLEFYGALPPSVARADARADGFHKIVLKRAASSFCFSMNGARADHLRLMDLPTRDLVFKVAVVQQITETTRRGLLHQFRFYCGDDYLPDIHLSGKRITVADHVLQRFSARAADHVLDDLFIFLLVLYGSPIISMQVGDGRALVVPYEKSLLAFTYEETDTEYILTTCLTVHEIHSLKPELPPLALNLHYGSAYSPPRLHTWFPTNVMMELLKSWTRKEPLPEPLPRKDKPFNWHWLAHWCRDYTLKLGYGPGAGLCFMDHIPGPRVVETKPGGQPPVIDELAIYKKTSPQYDWDKLFAERDAKLRPSAAAK